MTLKDEMKNTIFDSQDGLKNKLDRYDVELLATNLTNNIEKKYITKLR